MPSPSVVLQTSSTIGRPGLACAQATAMRTHVPPHTVWPRTFVLFPGPASAHRFRFHPHSLRSSACFINFFPPLPFVESRVSCSDS